jgi:hypothetical protein
MSEDPTRGHGFDELARSLAEGSISRRRALKLFAGTAIAALIPSRAMAIDCPSGTVKICHIPQTAGGACNFSEADTRCVTPEGLARHAGHPCDCCGGCGATNKCRENATRRCFPTPTTTTTGAGTTSTTTTRAGTTSTTTTRAGTTSTTTTCGLLKRGESCTQTNQCCPGLQCRGGAEHPNRLLCRPIL